MNKKDLKKLLKNQLIKLLLKQEKVIQSQNLNNLTKQLRDGESASRKGVKEIVKDYENLIIPPPEQFRDSLPNQSRDGESA